MLRRSLAVLTALITLALASTASGAPVRGPDVSNNNGCAINWGAVHAAGHKFGFAKANEGTGFVDRCFARNWGEMQHYGLVRGAYDFAHLNQSPVAEAHTFLRVVKAAGGLHRAIAVIDVEANPGSSTAANRAWVQAWINTVSAEGKPAKILVYTAPFFWNPRVGCWTPRGAGLWVATYGRSPSIPCGWGGWDFWQYTDGRYNYTSGPRSIPGVGPVDISIFSGDHARLLAYTEGVPQRAYASRTIRRGAVGTDVRGLQGAVNHRLVARRRHPIAVDARYGPASVAAVHFAKYALGFPLGDVKRRYCTGRCQQFIAHPNKRPKSYGSRAVYRKAHR